MPCVQIEHGFICNHTETELYLCLEHTTYLMTFSRQFGPYFFRIESGKEIDVEIGFNNNDEPTSNKFLWDMFEEWYGSKGE